MNNVETAFREAGHVVMTMLWGVWRVDKVSMADSSNVDGRIEYVCITETEEKELWQRLGTRFFEAKLERMMAGPVAQAMLLGRDVVYRWGTGDSDINCMIGLIQEGYPGSSPAEAWAVIREHEPVVQADLKRMWPVVEAVAQQLMGQIELCDHEIRSIVRTAVNSLPESERTWAISRLRNAPPR